jgi:hypothetical protein
MEKKFKNKKTLLVGEGINQHTLYGDFMVADTINDFAEVKVKDTSFLKHEQPNGAWSNEHKTLQVEKGNWVMGKQVEYNPFSQQVSRVWD